MTEQAIAQSRQHSSSNVFRMVARISKFRISNTRQCTFPGTRAEIQILYLKHQELLSWVRMQIRRTGLARALSKLGYCSRSAAVQTISPGNVTVNGRIVRDPERAVRIGRDRIEIDSQMLVAAPKVFFMLNKPRGVVTTASDEKQRKTVYELLANDVPWLAPVGRLDMASEGLLLLTNDSEWAARIADPASHIEKVYHLQVRGLVTSQMTDAMLKGVRSESEILRAKRVSIVRQGERNTWLEVALDEGKNRQIRRMMKEFELEVLRLIRISIGPLTLGDLAKGSSRTLTGAEKAALDRAIRSVKFRSVAG
jgi:23S rRNA pseudouridine2605 synthase